MDANKAKQILDKIVGQVFGYQNPYTLEEFMNKFAFDVRLPQQVYDSITNKLTWAQSTNPSKFISMEEAWRRQDEGKWDVPKKPLESIQDVLSAWAEINYTATERFIESTNVAESDNTYFSENIYRSLDSIRSKNILFTDGAIDCEYVVAGQRSNTSSFCIRLEDSQRCANSFSVSWSDSIVNSFFIHDCKDMSNSMFCSHMSGKQYCIANMQFTEEEYNRLKPMVLQWILTS